MKALVNCLVLCLIIGFVQCDRKSDPAPTAPLMKANVDGIAWQTSDAAITVNAINGIVAIEGWITNNNQVKSAIKMILYDDVKVGDYTDKAYPIYYEDDFQKGWATFDGYSIKINRLANNRASGTFSFDAYAAPIDSLLTPVRRIMEGTFENLPVE